MREKRTVHRQGSQQNHTTKKKKFHPVKTFFKIVISIVLAFLALTGGAAFACYKATGSLPFGTEVINSVADATLFDALMKRDIKMNVAVMGVDKDGTRTDVLFVVHYDSAAESIQLLSVPRDTRVSICDEVIANYNETGRNYSSVTKINAVHAYSDPEYACQNVVLQLEDLLNISIDHYVKVDIEAFRAIVDAIGGVDMYVPQDMYKDMRDTGDPLIDLKEGMQHLDGEKAEQLVRFRGYADGDVGRIEVQQLFLKALAEKVMSTETILKNLTDYVSVMYNYVKTDITLSDALKYVNYIDKIDMSKMSMETLPGVGQYIGGISYYIHDAEATREMVDRIFYTTYQEPAEGAEGQTSSVGLTIEVSNGGNINGLAGAYTDVLKEAGFTLAEATTYSGTQKEQTRILVKQAGQGEDLKSYFASAAVEVAPDQISDGVDIKIILGTGESAPK